MDCDRLHQHLLALVGDRHPTSSPAGLQRAEAYLTAQFHSLGLKVTTHAFEAGKSTYRNLIGTLVPRGGSSLAPLIVAAHYDTMPRSPGADDNASGLAVMLETARSLLYASVRRPVRFVGFCMEEDNLRGSLAYVEHLRREKEEIYGAIVLECVGYASTADNSQQAPPGLPIAVPTVGDFIGIIGNQASAEIVVGIEQIAKQQVPDLKTVLLVVPGQGERFPDTRRSDHAAFWKYGYPAVMLTDTANFRNPHYHRPSDTLDTLDMNFLGKVGDLVSAAATTFANDPRR